MFPLIPLPIIEAIPKGQSPPVQIEFPLIPLPIIEAIYMVVGLRKV